MTSDDDSIYVSPSFVYKIKNLGLAYKVCVGSRSTTKIHTFNSSSH